MATIHRIAVIAGDGIGVPRAPGRAVARRPGCSRSKAGGAYGVGAMGGGSGGGGGAEGARGASGGGSKLRLGVS